MQDDIINMIEKTLADDRKRHKDFILLVKRMRKAQERAEMITGEEDINFIDMLFVEQREAEREVDEYLKKMIE